MKRMFVTFALLMMMYTGRAKNMYIFQYAMSMKRLEIKLHGFHQMFREIMTLKNWIQLLNILCKLAQCYYSNKMLHVFPTVQLMYLSPKQQTTDSGTVH